MNTITIIQRQQVVDAAKGYVGTRYAHYGRDRRGLDCVGLLIAVGRDLGVEIKDRTDYNRTPDLADAEILRQMLRSQSVLGSVNRIQRGSIAMFKQAQYPCHLGIVFPENGQLMMIHAHIMKRRVVEEPLGEWYRDLIEIRDYPGVA